MHLTICWLTNRIDSHFEWFLNSLNRECAGNYSGIRLVEVDAHASLPAERTGSCGQTYYRIRPKPCVWQGEHRLTKEDWFAACNARNTGLCFAPDGWIAYVDDLSVLLPGWLSAVREAIAGNYVVCGAYQKVNNLVVEHGEVKSYDPIPGCIDSRWRFGNDSKAVECNGNFLYGCSAAFPVEALLAINGWPEDLCDGMGFEDCLTGIVLENNGQSLRYDRRMKTLESEELHFAETPLVRKDFGEHPKNKTHAALKIAREERRFEQSFGRFASIRELREHVLAGGEFPVPEAGRREWFTGKLLGEL